jgi:hypothetical protein
MSFETSALTMAVKSGLVNPEFYNGTLFFSADTQEESIDQFRLLALAKFGGTKFTAGRIQHSIDFVD